MAENPEVFHSDDPFAARRSREINKIINILGLIEALGNASLRHDLTDTWSLAGELEPIQDALDRLNPGGNDYDHEDNFEVDGASDFLFRDI